MDNVEQLQEQLETILSEAISQGQDIRGAYDIATENGEQYQVEITKVVE
jgi:hypothetical protein